MAAGNEFNARVFPIPAHGRKELVLSYSQEVGTSYALPLRGLPAIGALDVVATSRAGLVVGERHTRDVAPDSDFALHARSSEPVALRSRNIATVRVRPTVDASPDPIVGALILVDSSASRALGYAEQIALVRRLVSAMSPDAHVTIACFDQNVEVIHQGTARSFSDAAAEKMKVRGALGASNVSAALAWAKSFAGDAHAKRVVMVTDGVATAGTTKESELSRAVASLKDVGVERLDAIAVGGMRDDVALKALVTGGLARHGVVASSDLDGPGLAKKLTSRTRSDIKVQVAGATWVYPETIDGVQAGDEIAIYAEYPEGKDLSTKIDIALTSPGGRTERIVRETREGETSLVERAWDPTRIARRQHRRALAQTSRREPTHFVSRARDRSRLRALRHRSQSGKPAHGR